MDEERSVEHIYKRESDDPYKILAYNIMVDYPLPIVRRMLKDNKFLRREIIREVRGQDFRGFFTDCLFVSVLESKERMELMRQLDDLGLFFYRKLDLPRFRREIRNAFEEVGLSDLLEDK